MKPRAGVTLVEVLVAIFVMGIGMLALLTLFPIGALNMDQALRDDRHALAAANAAAIANALDVRYDSSVINLFTKPGFGSGGHDLTSAAELDGPSHPVFVDPFGVLMGAPAALGAISGTTQGLPRCSTSFTGTSAQALRWFSLPDDISNFGTNGVPSGTFTDRNSNYTWAYLLRRPRAGQAVPTELAVVVYNGRSTQVHGGEVAYKASGSKDTTSLTINMGDSFNSGQGKPPLRRTGWIIDTTIPSGKKMAQGFYYRVIGIQETGSNYVLELETPLRADMASMVILENAAEIFSRGFGNEP